MQQIIETRQLSTQQISAKQREIYATILRESKYLDGGNFTQVHPNDIERLFDLYDNLFFDGRCRQLLGSTPLEFRLSKRMTRSGGTTTRRELRIPNTDRVLIKYEIAVSTTLLFQTFRDDHRPVFMSGIECRDRLEALQRVIEHEMTHLVELLIWDKSSCSAPRFQSIANRFFGHTEHRHQLITPREHAMAKFGIRTGDRVSFRCDGRHHVGRVNRITRRATVLVEDPQGQPYSDGKRYLKFYVPVGMLTRTDK